MISTTTFSRTIAAAAALLMLHEITFAGAGPALQDLGVYGETYPIVERDALKEIKKRAASVDWSKVFDSEAARERVKNYRPEGLVSLPRAERDRVFLVDLTYKLPFDIPDGKGGVLYPRGYTINPLDHINYPKTLVVIDGEDHLQVEWFAASEYSDSLKTMLLITNGPYYDLAQRFKRPVFYLTSELAERLKLERVPSVIAQKGRYMEVREIALESKDTAKN